MANASAPTRAWWRTQTKLRTAVGEPAPPLEWVPHGCALLDPASRGTAAGARAWLRRERVARVFFVGDSILRWTAWDVAKRWYGGERVCVRVCVCVCADGVALLALLSRALLLLAQQLLERVLSLQRPLSNRCALVPLLRCGGATAPAARVVLWPSRPLHPSCCLIKSTALL